MPDHSSPTALDLWPFTSEFPLRGTDGTALSQTLMVSSVAVAVARGVVTEQDFAGLSLNDLCLVIAEEPDGGQVATFIVSTEDLLRHTVSLMQRLVAQVGPERARKVMQSVGGYPIRTLGSC